MSNKESMGIKKLEALHYYVHDIERSRKFYTEKLDFAETAHSSIAMEQRGKQRSAIFEAGGCRVVVSSPVGEGGRASRYLRKHPDGIGTLIFEVNDIKHAFSFLEARDATFIDDIETFKDEHGTMAMFSITTPFGDTTFRFVERKGYKAPYPGFEFYSEPKGGQNKLGFEYFDHITSNFQTMKPMLLWMEHVMGFERYWDIAFHTNDVAPDKATGSGLKSVVMWDPNSNVKFANNEPLRPFFKSSQINLFGEDHQGDGVQHAAIAVKDIISAVRELRSREVHFMPTPGTYYDALPARIKESGIEAIDEDINVLRDLEVLIDGEAKHKYLLQIFLQEAAGLYQDPKAGPFFYEVIQRKGDNGFGGGNFRALFESIERQQRNEGRI